MIEQTYIGNGSWTISVIQDGNRTLTTAATSESKADRIAARQSAMFALPVDKLV